MISNLLHRIKVGEKPNHSLLNFGFLYKSFPVHLNLGHKILPPMSISHLWKNLVFLSHSFNQISLGFCLHETSSNMVHLRNSSFAARLTTSCFKILKTHLIQSQLPSNSNMTNNFFIPHLQSQFQHFQLRT